MAQSPSSSNDPYASIGAVVDDPYASVGADPYAEVDEVSPYSPEGIAASRQALVQSEVRRRQLREEADAAALVPKVFVGVRKPFSDEIAAQFQVPEELAAFGAEAVKSSPSVAAGAAAASTAMPIASRLGAIPGPVGAAARFGIPLVAGGIAAMGTRLAQEEVLPQILPEGAQRLYENTGELAARNPTSALLGQFAGASPFFRPGLPLNTVGGARVAVPAITGVIGGGIEGANQIAEGQFDPTRLAAATLGSALMNRETALGRRIAPNMVLPNITAEGVPAELGALAAARRELPSPTDIVPDELGAMRQARQQVAADEIARQDAAAERQSASAEAASALKLRALAERMAGKDAPERLSILEQELKLQKDTLTPAEQRAGLEMKQALKREIENQKALEQAATAQQKSEAEAQKAQAQAQIVPEPPKSAQILAEGDKPPALANVATDIGTQTSPFAVQGKINELTGTPPPQIEAPMAPQQISQEPVQPSGGMTPTPRETTVPAPATTKRAQIKAAVADPNTEWQFAVQRGKDGRGGFVQVDSISGGENTVSSNIKDLNKAGANLPEVPDWVPQGKYTLPELEAIIKQGEPTNASSIESPTPVGEQPVGPQGARGEGRQGVEPVVQGTEAARNQVREGAVQESLMPSRVRVAGETYDVVRQNQDGTLTLRSEGGEFDTAPGEKWTEVAQTAPRQIEKIDFARMSREEYAKREVDAKVAVRKIALLEAENAIRRQWKPAKPLPVGASKVQALLTRERLNPLEKKLRAEYEIAARNVSTDLRTDFEHAGRVYDRLKEGATPVVEPVAPSREQRLNDAGADLPPITSMSRAAKRAELDAAGVTSYKGKPLDDANPAEISAAVGKLRRGESLDLPAKDIIETLQSRKRLPKRPRGEVAAAGPDLLYDAAHDAALDVAILGIRAGRALNEVIQMAVAKLRAMNPKATEDDIAALTKDITEAHGGRTTPVTEAEQLMAGAGSLEPVAGRATVDTQAASRMRQTRGAITPQAATSLAGSTTGGILGYTQTDQQPGETDEAYQARRLKNAAIGAAVGAGAGYAAGSGLGALARADARRGNRYASPTEPGTTIPKPGEGQGIRQTAEKIIENKSFPKRMRDSLANDPGIFYDQFGLNAMRDRVKATSESDLVALMASEDPFERLAATAELANRYALSPDPAKQEQAAVLARQFAQNMTNPAQLINLGKLIESPDAYVDAVRATLKGVDRDMSKAQQDALVNLKRDSLRTGKALDEASTAAKADFSAANERAYKAAMEADAKAALAVDKYVQRLAPESWGEILSKTMKGNLLTFRSLVQNPFGNLVFQPINRSARSIASTLDAGHSLLSGKPRTLSEVNPAPGGLEAKAFWQGVKVGAKELLTGPSADSYAKAEIQKGFEPVRSLVQAWTGEGLAVRPDGRVSINDRLKRLFEGTPMAVNAEAMFRFLSLGDKPFRRMEEMRVLLSQAKLKGLKGRELEKFLAFPDEATQRLIETEGRHAIFAQDNKGIRAVNAVLDHALADALNIPKDSPVRDVMKVAATTVAPFRQFPVNYVINSMNYALPALGYGRAIKAASQGDRRAAFIHAGEATMGLMMYGAAAWLWKNGLVSEPFSKDAKTRTTQYENMGPGRINLSGLERAMNGGNPRWQSGDDTRTWETIGVPSFVLSIYTDKAAKGRSEAARTGEPSRKEGAGMSTLYNPLGAFPGFASAALDQSFLAGVSSLLDAMRDPDRFMDAWSQNTFRAVSSIAVPNNLEAFARTQYQYIPELRGDTMTDSWKNIWDFKTRGLPKDDRALFKRGIWGQPIERTPGDKNPYLDQFVDVTKSQRRELDPLGKSLYALFEQTESPDVYPSIPDRNLTVEGVTVKLMPDAYDKYQQFVGAARQKYAQMVVDHPGFIDPATSPEAKLMALGEAYAEGAKAGRSEFVQSLGSVYFPDLFDKPATEFSRSRIAGRDVKARGRLREQGGN